MSDELDDQEYLKRIRNFDGNALAKLRDKYAMYGVNYLKSKENADSEEAKDVCAQFFANLWAGMTRGKITEIGHFHAYFFSSIQKLWGKQKKREAKFDKADYREYLVGEYLTFPPIEYGKIEKAKEILEKMKQSDERCAELLTLYYVDESKHEEISKIMNLKNSDSSKSTKARCMKKFKALFLS